MQKGKGHSYACRYPKGNGWHLTSMKPKSDNVLKFRKKGHSYRKERLAKNTSIYFRSSMGIDFPKAPYLGQVHYDFDLKKDF